MQLEKIKDKISKFSEKNKIDTIEVGIYENGNSFQISTNATKNYAFQIASITKVFTAVTIQNAIQENYFSLNSTLSDIFKPTVDLNKAFANITIHELLTHTSGLPRIPNELLEIMKQDEKNPYSTISKDDVWRYLQNPNSLNEKKYEYSNFGYGILSLAIDIVYKSSFPNVVKAKIFDVLNMKESSINPSENNKHLIIDGFDTTNNITPIWTDNTLSGAGAMITTVKDYLKFIEAHFSNQKISPILLSLFAPQTKQMCFGWHRYGFLGKLSGLGGYSWHNGAVGGYSSYTAINPKKQKGVIVLANKGTVLDELGFTVLSYL